MDNINSLLDDGDITADTNLVSNPHLKVVHTSNDEILVKHSARSPFSKVVRDEGQTKLLGKILRNMTTPSSLNNLLKSGYIEEDNIEDAVKLAQYLSEEDILVNPNEDVTQLYLDTLISGEGRLSDKKIAIIGSGYLGKRIAVQLVDLGIGELSLIDDRKIESPNIEERFFGLGSQNVDYGQSYVSCVKEYLNDYGFDKVSSFDTSLKDVSALTELFKSSDMVVVAWESLTTSLFHSINSVAIETKRNWLLVHMDGSEAFVGPLFTPGESACYSEFEVQYEASAFGVKDELLVYKEALNELDMDRAPLILPCYMDMAAASAVTGLLHYIASGKSHLVGRCLRHDFERLTVDYEEVLRLPRCPACAPFRPYRHPYL